MASVKKRGPNTYQITVSDGYNRSDKKIAKYKTVTLSADMTAKQQEKEIRRIANKFEEEVKSGKHFDQNMTFEMLVIRWLVDHAEKQLERQTISSYKSELDSKILPAIGHIKLADLKPLHLIHFYDNLTKDGVRADGKTGSYSTRTIKYQHQIISSILQTAVQWQILEDNIAKRVRPPKGLQAKKKDNYFDDSQAIAFLAYLENEPLKYQTLAHVTVYGGFRLEEVLPLVWEDIDFNNHTIDINKALSYVDREQIVKDTTKNKSSIRRISLPPHVFSLLKRHKIQSPGERVFNMHYSTPNHWLKKAIKRYNDTNQAKLPDISFHGLRHPYVKPTLNFLYYNFVT